MEVAGLLFGSGDVADNNLAGGIFFERRKCNAEVYLAREAVVFWRHAFGLHSAVARRGLLG